MPLMVVPLRATAPEHDLRAPPMTCASTKSAARSSPTTRSPNTRSDLAIEAAALMVTIVAKARPNTKAIWPSKTGPKGPSRP